ncbi:MAG: HlyD family efflux transporter periplasmic adaptor subunit [Phycisphaerales bacterium]|nr:MAG: HlyD family efflux transporter periplasmic adaptor subunit [Phycisphaerales bacterium]
MQTKEKSRRKGRGFGAGKIITVLAVISLAGVGGIYLAQSGESDSRVLTAELHPASIMDFEITALASGELEAARSIEIKNPLDVSSTIEELVPEGTFVRRGDVLVKLNTEELQNRLQQEELAVVNAQNDFDQADGALKIQLSENATRLRDAQLRLDLARLALQRWKDGEVSKRREELRIANERATRELKRLSDRFERSQTLHADGFLSSDELQRDEIAHLEAIATLKIAELNTQIYEDFEYPEAEKSRMADVTNAEDNLARTIEQNEINRLNRQAALETRREQLRLRIENRDKLRAQVEAAIITAPADGLVVYESTMQSSRRSMNDGPLSVGQQIRPRETLIFLPDTTEMVAAVRIHESLQGRVRPGQRATVRVDAVDTEFSGVVRSVGLLAETGGWRDPNRREYTVRIAIDREQNNLERVKPSMRCDATIVIGQVEQTVSIPVQAVFSRGPVQYVYVPEGQRVRSVPVWVGRRSDTFAEIRGGIEPGTPVLLREPRSGEAMSRDWTPEQLAQAAYLINDEGEIVPDFEKRGIRRGGSPAAAAAAPGPGARPAERPSAQSGDQQASGQAEQRQRRRPAEQASTPSN